MSLKILTLHILILEIWIIYSKLLPKLLERERERREREREVDHRKQKRKSFSIDITDENLDLVMPNKISGFNSSDCQVKH